ncbi:AmmeMemoRadiSam system protein A [Bacillota bacterium]
MSVLAAYIVPHPPLIVPEVGGGRERTIRKTVEAYEAAASEIGALRPDTLVLISPHSIMYQDYIHISPGKDASGDFRRFGDRKTSLKINYDVDFVSALAEIASDQGIPAGTLGERDKSLDHGTLVPLYFIGRQGEDIPVVRISVSGLSLLDHYRLGKCIKAAGEKLNRRLVVVASGDLSHRLKEEGPYSYAEEGPAFDEIATKAMAAGDFLSLMSLKEEFCEAAGECGLRSFVTMAGALDGMTVDSRLLSYEGPFGVGYAVAAFHPGGADAGRHMDILYYDKVKTELARTRAGEDVYVSLARQSLESYVKKRKYIDLPSGLPVEIAGRRAGVFVSLKKDGRLRGCIGTISPVEGSIGREIIRNAVSAGTGDPRFDPVEPEELEELVYSVDVLGEPEAIDSMDQLDVIRFGVIVSAGRKRGLLLPNLEGVTSPEQQVEIALKKAGIPAGDDYSMERFEVVRHK